MALPKRAIHRPETFAVKGHLDVTSERGSVKSQSPKRVRFDSPNEACRITERHSRTPSPNCYQSYECSDQAVIVLVAAGDEESNAAKVVAKVAQRDMYTGAGRIDIGLYPHKLLIYLRARRVATLQVVTRSVVS